MQQTSSSKVGSVIRFLDDMWVQCPQAEIISDQSDQHAMTCHDSAVWPSVLYVREQHVTSMYALSYNNTQDHRLICSYNLGSLPWLLSCLCHVCAIDLQHVHTARVGVKVVLYKHVFSMRG